MKIIDALNHKKVTVSFEVFPPKGNDTFVSVENAVTEIAGLKPDFISVTYGAGGGTSNNTVKIASHIQNELQVTALAHLSCVSSTKEEVHSMIQRIKENHIENILALRGDIPSDTAFPLPNHYRYASELVEEIKKSGDFCIGAACYPEGHVECEHKEEDILNLKKRWTLAVIS